MSKTQKTSNKMIMGQCIDRISKLPDEVLCCVLSQLPTKEAVATSVLSKRWEHIWTSTPNLDFSDCLLRSKDYETEIWMFKDYVDNVLFHHDGAVIEKCSLSCYSRYASDYLYAWICAVMCCGVQEFILNSTRLESEIKDFPWTVFTCKTLVVLKITGRFILNLPSCILPNLKTLHLDSVIYVDDDSVQRLFSGCPSLEELDIRRSSWDGMLILNVSIPLLKRLSIIFPEVTIGIGTGHETKINAPYLEYLALGDNVSTDYFIKPTSSLNEARVFHNCLYGILQGIQNVRLLALSGDIMGSLRKILEDHEMPKFKHVSQLELGVGEYIDWSLLPKLLESAPNLKVLVFPKGLVVPIFNSGQFRRFYWESPENVPECLSFHLKTIKIHNFVGVPGEVYLVKFLLKSSKVLEGIIIHCYNLDRGWKMWDNHMVARNDIANAPRGSNGCQVEFIGIE
ncbi:hypothetical protein ACFE04_013843 [Oxalis oulophora]